MLADFHAVGLEEYRQTLELFALRPAQRAEVQAGWCQKVRHGHEVIVRFVGIHTDGIDGTKGGRIQRQAGPPRVLVLQDIQAVPDILQLVQDEVVFCVTCASQALAIGGLEQDGKLALAFEIRVEIGCQQRAARPGLSADCPVCAQLQQELVLESADRGIVRLVDPGPLIPPAHEFLVGEKRDAPLDKFVSSTVVVDNFRADADVLRFAFENQLRLLQGRAARPLFDDPRVAGSGQRAGTEVGANVERVAVAPGDVALGFRQVETIGDKCLCVQVKFPHHRRIRPASREQEQTAVERRVENFVALPNPVLLFLARKLVQIEHDLPGGLSLFVFGQGCPPPQTADVFIVTPEVVAICAMLFDVRDSLFGIENRQQPPANRLEIRRCLQLARADRVLLLDPGQCPLPGDIFQPEIGIFRGASNCRRRLGGLARKAGCQADQ